VLRTRIDRFGVVQPNIQTVEGQMGRIMVELPGIKEPERVRKLLQGSANLEFWETYDAAEILPLELHPVSNLRRLPMIFYDKPVCCINWQGSR
jgi:SecD/SecF fusion protein